MILQTHDIFPILQPYVKLICTMDCTEEADTQQICVLPDTCVELFINYTTTPIAVIENKLYPNSIVSARMSRPTNVQMRKGNGCIAVCFKPGMAYQFFKVPMNLLSNHTTELTDLWPDLATVIEEKMAKVSNNKLRAQIVQNHLLALLKAENPDVYLLNCTEKIRQSSALLSVNQLKDGIGISQRQLLRKFQQHVGITPKEYLAVSRFVNSLRILKRYPDVSLTTIALQSGYYDQSHFIREYKTYTGHTPGEVAKSSHILF